MNSANPQLTVILPTHNRAGYLEETIESVLSQTFTGFELIVVDDGSTDHTEEVVRKFSEVSYIRCPINSGVSKARNIGIEQAQGQYISFLDSDDLWVETKLKTQIDWMDSHPECRVCYTDEIWIRRGIRVNPMKKHAKFSGDIFAPSLKLCIVSPSSVMMRSSLFADVGVFDESMPVCEDYDLWLRIAAKHAFHFIDEKLIVKRGGHEDQLSSRYWGMDRFRVHALEKLLQPPPIDEKKGRLVIAMLEQKCRILIQGFCKRGKMEEADHYRAIIEKYGSPEK